jgi:hypothetical protein
MADRSLVVDQLVAGILRDGGSGERAKKLADRLEEEMLAVVDPDLFWLVISNVWPVCDNTWTEQDRLLGMMREAGPSRNSVIASPPDRVSIFRGGDISRVFGMSWAAELCVAETFLRGHRALLSSGPFWPAHGSSDQELWQCLTNAPKARILLILSTFAACAWSARWSRPIRQAAIQGCPLGRELASLEQRLQSFV